MVEIKVVRLDKELPLPEYAREGDAGIDLLAREDALIPCGGGRVLVPTGLAVAIPRGYAGFVLPRSGLALKHGISAANSPGLIDAGYRGELKVIVLNTDSSSDYQIKRGDRIAQMVVARVADVAWREERELPGSVRGQGGFGSTGRAVMPDMAKK